MAYPIVRLRFLLSRNDGGVWGKEPTGDNDSIVLRSTDQTMDGQWSLSEPAVRGLNSNERTAARLAVDDLLVTKTSGSSAHIGKTTLVNTEIAATGACFGNFMQRLRVGSRMHPRFLWYLMNLELVRNQFVYLSTTTTGLSNLSARDISQVGVPAPPHLDGQRAIADYLDQETAQIDALVAKQVEFIGLLRERRLSQITDAFSRLGEPDSELRRVAHIQTGVTLSGDGDPLHPKWPYLRVANVQMGRVDLEEVKRIRLSPADAEASMLRAGDVLMTEGGDIDKLGRGTVWAGTIDPIVHQNHVFAVRANRDRLVPEYLAWWLDSITSRRYFYLTAKKTTNLASTNKTVVGRLPINVPAVDEQRSIATQLDEQTARIDTLIAKAEEHITLAKERRAALITAAVTGQFDVRTPRKAG